jgi:hypothetical protein
MLKFGFQLGCIALAVAPAIASPTRLLGIEVDRDGARVLGASVRARPFPAAPEPPAIKAYVEGAPVQLEVALLGPKGERITIRTDVSGLCLAHPAWTEPHVQGDTIELHRETFVAEVPDLPGYDRVEVAYYDGGTAAASRRVLGTVPVVPEPDVAPLAASVLWPESFGDPEMYSLYGDAAAVAERINVVIVPDGYTYAEKNVMQSHMQALVNYFRAKTPYKEHDGFVNYVLVYAYSTESGTDQCDCGVIRNTAMGSRFPNDGYPCGDSGNRCLFYGGQCDTDGGANLVAAELRAPAADKTIVMVNTARYGGCGGSRAVYSAGNFQAVEIAGHELGHSLGDLEDEYGGAGCGTVAFELNTSTNGVTGAWPEWIGDIGPPKAGAQYYDSCLYRPETSCEMRSLGPPFCHVCNQQWGLTFFGHPRVAPTAPVRSASPAPGAVTVDVGFPVSFGVTTRFAAGAGVTNAITWTLRGGGTTVIGSGVDAISYAFPTVRSYTLACEVVADTNFIKKEKFGTNHEVTTWTVNAVSFPVPAEVAALGFTGHDDITWAEASGSGSSAFNLYRGTIASVAAGDYGTCVATRLPSSAFSDTEVPPPGETWTYLVAGVTSSGEGTIGSTSSGAARVHGAPCN